MSDPEGTQRNTHHGSSETVDWECQNCGEFNRQPRDDPPTDACLWCDELVGWAIAEHDQFEGSA